TEADAPIEGYRAVVACIDFQLYCHNALLLCSLQDCGHERGTDAAMPTIGRDVKLLEPSDRTTMLPTEDRGNIGNSHNSTAVPRQHEEPVPHVCGSSRQHARQGLYRRLNAVLFQLID